MSQVPFVTAAEVERLLDYPSLVEALRRGFSQDWTVPVRHHYGIPMPNGEPEQTLLLMPAWEGGKAIGMKMVTVTPGNGQRNLPAVQGVYLLLDGATGLPRALIDGPSLTARRTAAASALAADYLAREDAHLMLMVGAGALAVPLVEAHRSVRPIKQVRLWARDARKAAAKVKELVQLGVDAEVADNLEESAREADVISCATLSTEPLIHGAWLKPGSHLDLIGAFTPQMRETDDVAIGLASLFVDTRDGAMKEGGDIVQPLKAGLIKPEAIKADLFDLARKTHRGRSTGDEVTLFKSVGTALEDFAAARLVVQRLSN
ncbi:MAG: ornithine cyclodeaminase family protein [Rhodospirillaceae bacterium]|nr:MAG: ornithine cyclodeaminase family protein [Rhodospirillaceae bacterium]